MLNELPFGLKSYHFVFSYLCCLSSEDYSFLYSLIVAALPRASSSTSPLFAIGEVGQAATI